MIKMDIEKNMGKVINLDEINRKDSRFMMKVLPIIKSCEQRHYFFIVEKDIYGNKRNSIYSDYFFSEVLGESMLNLSFNTKKNFHARFIVMFLNYILHEMVDAISNIEDLTIDNVKDFLERYSCGEIGRKSYSKVNGSQWKSSETALDAGTAITKFCYWLVTGRDKDKKLRFKMKFISRSDFEIITSYKRCRYSSKKKEVKSLKILCDYERTRNSIKRKKVVTATMYMIASLIEVANSTDKMMVFPIVLGAFVGLRQGDVCQMHRGRMVEVKKSRINDCYIDLRVDCALRDDGRYVGNIKVKREQPIYPVFLDIVNEAYAQHLELLQAKGYDTHIHGALLIDNNGKAMAYSTYYDRYQKLVEILKKSLLDIAESYNDTNAIKAYEILTEKDTEFTHHSFRHFYTQQIDKLEKNLIVTQYYRGDNSSESQNDYKGNMASSEGIKMVQKWFLDELNKLGIKSILRSI
ncbi:hypothetical protein [Clostridium perfringens]|uniref:hypothetical protein n=1 Tax=Clostridium perfringens TaxID=1502 RepID=UPI0013E3F43E|nr:hypothetical protein [Clostridium perfringens]NGT78858.1 hypothetical protein [Clostridium perfringens]